MRRLCAIVLIAAGAVPAARADIIPQTGTQAMSGVVSIINLSGQPQKSQSYSLVAANPLASWAPPAQHISVYAGIAAANIDATFGSTIGPGALSFVTGASASGGGVAIGGNGLGGPFNHAQTFSLQFLVTEAAQYTVSAGIARHPEGWQAYGQTRLSFGPMSQTPLVLLSITSPVNPGSPQTLSFSSTVMTLNPGLYTVDASDTTSWVGFHSASLQSSMMLSITLVPAPYGAFVLVLAAAVARRRPCRAAPARYTGRARV